MPRVPTKHSIEHISCSSYCTFRRCPFKYYLQNLERLEKPDFKPLALDYGKVMHLCLPLCYDGDATKAIELFNSEWSQLPYGSDDKVRNPLVAAHALRNFAMMRSDRLRPYDLVRMPFDSPTGKDKVSEWEVTFAIDIGGKLPFVGRIDAPIKMRSDGSIWPMDYKTSREVSDRLFNDLIESPQAIGYTLAVSHLFGTDCKGTAFEVIRSSDKNQEVQFFPSYIKSFQISEFMAELNRATEEILQYNDQQEWPRRRTGCGSYSCYGVPSYQCQYKNLCSQHAWEEMTRYFVQREKFDLFETGSSED